MNNLNSFLDLLLFLIATVVIAMMAANILGSLL